MQLAGVTSWTHIYRILKQKQDVQTGQQMSTKFNQKIYYNIKSDKQNFKKKTSAVIKGNITIKNNSTNVG